MQIHSGASSNSLQYTQQREQSTLQLDNKEVLNETRKTEVKNVVKLEEEKEKEKELKNDEKKNLLKDQIQHLNEMMKTNYTSLKFNLHEDLDRYYVQVIDQSSEKVIREIPDKKFLDMVSKMMDYMGVLIDKKI